MIFFPNFYGVRFQNRAKSGNLGKIVRFAIRTKPNFVLIEFVLSEDSLYFKVQVYQKTLSIKAVFMKRKSFLKRFG